MLRRVIQEAGDETIRALPGFLEILSVIALPSRVPETYHSFLHVINNAQEHFGIFLKPRVTLTLPACHPFRDIHHPWEEIDEIIARKSGL